MENQNQKEYTQVAILEPQASRDIEKRYKADRKLLIGGCIVIVCLIVLVVIVVVVVINTAGSSPSITTTCGDVTGLITDNAYTFLGIPYAAPPIGQLRWKPPIPLSRSNDNCWSNETFEAIKEGSQCSQLLNGNYTGSEDCLYLNVWTPRADDDAMLPVVVWIHGGRLQSLNSTVPGYSPSAKLANETQIVYVGINYRLSNFGFLSLELLSGEAESGSSGNYGFMDQILALKWVNENIQNFGGDPNTVTLFGHDSGGSSVRVHLASPLTEGLFQQAWISSGSTVLTKSSAEASRDNEIFLDNTDCYDLSCLRSLSAEQVLRASPWDDYPTWAMGDMFDLPRKNLLFGGLIVIDGNVVTESWPAAWTKGKAKDVPTLIGTTAQEVDFNAPDDLDTWDELDYERSVHRHLDSFKVEVSERALELYPITQNQSVMYQYTSMVSDVRATCPNIFMAKTIASNIDSRVYYYVFKGKLSQPVVTLSNSDFQAKYAFHGLDVFSFFGSLEELVGSENERDKELERTIRSEVVRFVKTGSVSSRAWRPVPKTIALLGETVTTVKKYESEKCSFWNKNGFLPYAWVN